MRWDIWPLKLYPWWRKGDLKNSWTMRLDVFLGRWVGGGTGREIIGRIHRATALSLHPIACCIFLFHLAVCQLDPLKCYNESCSSKLKTPYEPLIIANLSQVLRWRRALDPEWIWSSLREGGVETETN